MCLRAFKEPLRSVKFQTGKLRVSLLSLSPLSKAVGGDVSLFAIAFLPYVFQLEQVAGALLHCREVCKHF